jgi:hypothetical protein
MGIGWWFLVRRVRGGGSLSTVRAVDELGFLTPSSYADVAVLGRTALLHFLGFYHTLLVYCFIPVVR